MASVDAAPLRIFNGDAAVGGFREAFGKEESTDVLICRDVLICGPLPEVTSLEEWRTGREAFWREVLGNTQDGAALSGEAPIDVTFANHWRDLHGDTEELKSADEIEVWIGCALSDQILLAFVVFLIDLYGIDRNKLSVVQMRERDGRVIRGIGELYPEQIRAHPPPERLSDEQFSYCLDVWRAVTSATPELLITELSREDAPLSLMHNALQALRFRYPDSINGLSLWDEMMLDLVDERGRKAARIVGGAMTAEDSSGRSVSLDSVGDLYLYYRLRNLASPELAQPLAQASSLDAPMGFAEYRLTEFGALAQIGERNAIFANGIDDWVCGVHLSSEEGQVWVREDGAIVRRSG
ncbi:MAG: DUF1835 domain-containing protein [Woeseiaceae bacterium]|nr:DUF1835 domain-containing protein [Woeseiaceae bacterium]